MSVRAMGPCLAVEGSTTREVFETYLEQLLAPSLRPGQVVVMDNLSSHKRGRVRELIEGKGCELLYLPPYSPDLNPIEEAFAKLKALLRKGGARTREAFLKDLPHLHGLRRTVLVLMFDPSAALRDLEKQSKVELAAASWAGPARDDLPQSPSGARSATASDTRDEVSPSFSGTTVS